MSEKEYKILHIATVVLIVLALLVSSATLYEVGQGGVQTMGVTNFDSLELSDSSSTAVLSANQAGTGDIATFKDNGTAIWTLADGGALTYTGNQTINGNLTVTGTSNLQGNVYDSGSVLTIADNALVDGQADAVQLTVQGYTTQTSQSFVVETSAGTDKFTVDNSGNTVVVGTSDLQGNVSDSLGVFTLADNALVDGQADAVQLTVQGYTTQTSQAFVVENSGGTDKFTVDNSGNVVVEGTSNLKGDLSDSGGDLTVADNISVTGVIKANDGTSAAPGYTFGSDTNSGMYWVSADNVAVAVAGGRVLDVNAAGVSVAGIIENGDGNASNPAYTFSSDPNSGLYSIGVGNTGLAVSGTLVSDWSYDNLDMNALPILNIGAAATDFGATGGLTMAAAIEAYVGSAALPGLAFNSDEDSGVYRVGANNVGVAVSGTLVSDWSYDNLDMNSLPILNIGAAGTDFGATGGLTLAAPLEAYYGTAALPGLAFNGDEDTGVYRGGANTVGFAANGVPALNVNTVGTVVTGTLIATGQVTGTRFSPSIAGSASAPTYMSEYDDTDTGLWSQGDNIIGIAAGGAESARVNASGLQFLTPILLKTASYTLTVVESGIYLANYGAGAGITITLPAAEAGVHYCLGIGAAQPITITPAASDIILGLTDAADNKVKNDGTVGDSVCIIALDDVRWIPVGAARGTWADIN
jgi:hypothetical protein